MGYVINSSNTLLRDHLRYGIPHPSQYLTTISVWARLKNTTGPGPAALLRREHFQIKTSGIPGAVPRWAIPQMTPTQGRELLTPLSLLLPARLFASGPNFASSSAFFMK